MQRIRSSILLLTWREIVGSHLQVGKLVGDVTALVHSTQGQNKLLSIETSVDEYMKTSSECDYWVSVINGLDYWTHPTP